MKVDIVLISYNQEKYIAQAVESILMQRVNDDVQVRIIVADDCSTDRTLEIIKSYEEKSPFPFEYLPTEQNVGHVHNYQRAFAACDGDYVAILEGDDYWCSPNHISQHLTFLDVHHECAMSVNGIILLWEHNNSLEINPRESTEDVIYVNIKQQILQNHIGNHSSTCYRTHLLKKVPECFYADTFDDALLGIFFAQFGFIAKLKDNTTIYRKHSLGLWGGQTIEYHKKEVLRRIKINDQLFEYRYHDFFENAAAQYATSKTPRKIKDFIPPIFGVIIRFLLPPVCYSALKNLLKNKL